MFISKRKLEPFSVGAQVVSDFLVRRGQIFELKEKILTIQLLRQKSQKSFKHSQSYDVVYQLALLESNELRFLSCKHLTLVLVQGCFYLIKLLFSISFVWKVIFCFKALCVALLLL